MKAKQFAITERVNITPIDPDIDRLEEALFAISRKQNRMFGFFNWQPRVMYHVFDRGEDQVAVHIIFRSQDKEKYPDKYGDVFRIECHAIVREQANELLNDKRETMIVRIHEDDQELEKILYERQ